MKKTTLTFTMVIGAIALTSSQAGILVQDQFQSGLTPASGEYTADAALNTQGPTGGSIAGFSGSWTADSNASFGAYTTIATGLQYSAGGKALDTSGGSVHFTRTNAYGATASAKPAYRSATASTGTTLYGSVLVSADDWVSSAGNPLTFEISAASTFSFGVDADGFANFNGTAVGGSALSTDTTHLLVFKIDEPGVSGDENWSFWIDPTDLTAEGTATDTGLTGGNYIFNSTSSITNIRVEAESGSSDALYFDEFKLGDGWSYVVSIIPEPSSASMLLAFGALALAISRRRS